MEEFHGTHGTPSRSATSLYIAVDAFETKLFVFFLSHTGPVRIHTAEFHFRY